MPQVQEILELDLLTLREHTERAGDQLDPDRLRKSIESTLPISEVAVVRRRGVLVAYAMLQPREAGQWFVTGFNTHPGHRSAPVFRALFGQLLAITSRRGITSLRSNVYKTNRRSMAFHARLGFRVTRENANGVEFTASVSELLAKSRESLAQEVLKLLPDVRSKLLDRVDESLDMDRARDAAWDASAAQRDAEIESGAVQPVPVAEVLARLRAELE